MKTNGKSHPTWCSEKYWWTHSIAFHSDEVCKSKVKGHQEQATATINMGDINITLYPDLWWLGSNTVENFKLNLVNSRQTNHTYSGNQHNNLDTNGISNTDATHNYIRYRTPCINKNPVSYVPQVILPYRSLIQSIYQE